MPSDLLAVAVDDEQAVVNRQAEAQPGDHVHREDRHRRHIAREAKNQERPQDREAAHEERKERGDEAPEEDQRQGEQDRKREHLRGSKVAFDLLVDLPLDHRRSSHDRRAIGGQAPGDLARGVLPGLVRRCLQGDREIRGRSIARDELRSVRLGIANDRLHHWIR